MSPEKKRKRDKGTQEFAHVDAELVVAVPPVFAANPAQGVEEMLDSMLMRYIPPLRGVVLAHDSLRFLSPTAELLGDSPFAVARVAFGATVWSPRVGQRLTGRITLSSPDHVALLVHRTFNAAIPAAHVPRDQWEFVPGAAEEAGADASAEDAVMGDLEEMAVEAAVAADDDAPSAQHTPGHWMHTETHTHLGGPSRTLTFTVISLTIANQMLSLVGSLLPDPFAPPPNPTPAAGEEDDLLPAPSDPDPDLDADVFAALGRSTDAAMRGEEARVKKKKKKRKEGEDGGTEGVKEKKKKRKTEEDEGGKEKKKRKKEEGEGKRKKVRKEKMEET